MEVGTFVRQIVAPLVVAAVLGAVLVLTPTDDRGPGAVVAADVIRAGEHTKDPHAAQAKLRRAVRSASRDVARASHLGVRETKRAVEQAEALVPSIPPEPSDGGLIPGREPKFDRDEAFSVGVVVEVPGVGPVGGGVSYWPEHDDGVTEPYGYQVLVTLCEVPAFTCTPLEGEAPPQDDPTIDLSELGL